MLIPKVLSIRSRLFLMVGVGSLCGMLLLVHGDLLLALLYSKALRLTVQ